MQRTVIEYVERYYLAAGASGLTPSATAPVG
jgi:hypothetical protein